MRSLVINSYNTFRNGVYAAAMRYMELRRFIPQRGGFFIEAGANDGVTQSNTYGLERWAAWKGLLVEPLPSKAAQCARIRKRSIIEQVALVPFDYSDSEIVLHDCNLMSFVASGGDPGEESRRIAEAAAVQHLTPQDIRVPAVTLETILDRHAIERIDLLSLDVEGYELSVLNGFDILRRKPAFCLIEHGDRVEITSKLPDYEIVHRFANDDALFKRK